MFKERVEYGPVTLGDHLIECRAISRPSLKSRKILAQLGRNTGIFCGIRARDRIDLGTIQRDTKDMTSQLFLMLDVTASQEVVPTVSAGS